MTIQMTVNNILPFKYFKDLSDNLQILEILDEVTQFDFFNLFYSANYQVIWKMIFQIVKLSCYVLDPPS